MRHERVTGERLTAAGVDTSDDAVCVEAPLQILINGRPFTVTMRTPGDDTELVRGLLHTEAVIRADAPDYRIDMRDDDRFPGTCVADVCIPEAFVCEGVLERRTLIAQASCGLCGKQSLEDIGLVVPEVAVGEVIGLGTLTAARTAMHDAQSLHAATGGAHAAAAFDATGRLLCCFEDIGRHNAVDKLVGHRVGAGTPNLILVSGRISFEIVAKAAALGTPVLAGVSAASSLAVRIADAAGMTLLAFCRDDRATVYTHAHRVT